VGTSEFPRGEANVCNVRNHQGQAVDRVSSRCLRGRCAAPPEELFRHTVRPGSLGQRVGRPTRRLAIRCAPARSQLSNCCNETHGHASRSAPQIAHRRGWRPAWPCGSAKPIEPPSRFASGIRRTGFASRMTMPVADRRSGMRITFVLVTRNRRSRRWHERLMDSGCRRGARAPESARHPGASRIPATH
jgi:hypothetical protein